jgi:hypothetical protein
MGDGAMLVMGAAALGWHSAALGALGTAGGTRLAGGTRHCGALGWLGDSAGCERFELMHVGRDFLLGVERDDLDVEHVRLHRLRKG